MVVCPQLLVLLPLNQLPVPLILGAPASFASLAEPSCSLPSPKGWEEHPVREEPHRHLAGWYRHVCVLQICLFFLGQCFFFLTSFPGIFF